MVSDTNFYLRGKTLITLNAAPKFTLDSEIAANHTVSPIGFCLQIPL
jgi:hypothetical protein